MTSQRLKLSNSRQINWREHLESLMGRKATLLTILSNVHIYSPMRNYYNQHYCQAGFLSSTTEDGPESSQEAAWRWRAFPKLWLFLVWYRRASTFYMSYMVIKYMFPAALKLPLSLFYLSKPLDCYILGRFLPIVEVRRGLATLFALYHLGWRFVQFYLPRPNYLISTVYFLLLDDRDILNYYKLLEDYSHQRPAGAKYLSGANMRTREEYRTNTACNHHLQQQQQQHHAMMSRCTMLMHDTMSLHLNQQMNARVGYKLRPNRTPEACKLLRRRMTNILLATNAFMWPLNLPVALLMCIFWLDTQNYLENYPGCSLKLEEHYSTSHTATNTSELEIEHSDWLLHLRGHHLVAVCVDVLENAVVWTEGGFALMFGLALTQLLSYDLILYWRYLDKNVARLLSAARARTSTDKSASCEQEWDREICELQMEWEDFIKQIGHTDTFIGEGITMALIVWFSLFGLSIYDLINNSHRVISPLMLNLLIIICSLIALSSSLMALHRHCLTSYTSLCSLMAHDRSKHKLNFLITTDYFIEQRTCFTLFRRQPMTVTTCATIVGWSFSCFFIVVSLNRD